MSVVVGALEGTLQGSAIFSLASHWAGYSVRMSRGERPLLAAEVLEQCETPCPAGLPSGGVLVRIAPPWLRVFWRGPFAAISLPWGIYLRESAASMASPTLGRLIVHELVHAEQWKRLGVGGFLRRYLSDYLRGRRRGLGHLGAYAAISLEEEARLRSGA